MTSGYGLKAVVCGLVLAGFGVGAVTSDASAKRRRHHHHHEYPHVRVGQFDLGDRRIFVAGSIAGAASTVGYFALRDRAKFIGDGAAYGITSIGCAVGGPMLAAAIVYHSEGRPLTSREALGLGASCFVPIIGSYLVNKAYDAHPEWEGKQPARARTHRRHRVAHRR